MKAIVYMFLFLILLVGDLSMAFDKSQVKEVSFETTDGGRIVANQYGKGKYGVILAHGAIFNKESWHPFASTLADQGFCVLSIDFRGYGKSISGSNGKVLYEDVLGAVRYLDSIGAEKISAIGGSMGGGAVAQAAVVAEEGTFFKVILLSPVPIKEPEKIKANEVIYIVSKDEKLMLTVEKQYKRVSQPKIMEVLEGDAHAQHIFKTSQASRLTELIVAVLNRP